MEPSHMDSALERFHDTPRSERMAKRFGQLAHFLTDQMHHEPDFASKVDGINQMVSTEDCDEVIYVGQPEVGVGYTEKTVRLRSYPLAMRELDEDGRPSFGDYTESFPGA